MTPRALGPVSKLHEAGKRKAGKAGWNLAWGWALPGEVAQVRRLTYSASGARPCRACQPNHPALDGYTMRACHASQPTDKVCLKSSVKSTCKQKSAILPRQVTELSVWRSRGSNCAGSEDTFKTAMTGFSCSEGFKHEADSQRPGSPVFQSTKPSNPTTASQTPLTKSFLGPLMM